MLLLTPQIFKHLDEHVFVLLNICLVSVPDEFHVHSPIAHLLALVERLLLLKVIEVLIRNLRLYCRLVGCSPLPQIAPVESFKELMSFNLVSSVAP